MDKTYYKESNSIASNLLIVVFLIISVVFIISLGHYLPASEPEALVAGIFCLLLAAVFFIRFPYRVLMAFATFLLLQDLLVRNLETSSPGIGGVVKHADEALIVVFFFLTILRLAAVKMNFHRSRLEVPLVGFVIVSLLGTAIVGSPLGIAVLQLFLYLKGFILFFVIIQLPVDRKVVRRFIRYFAGLGVLILLAALADLISPTWFRSTFGTVAPGELLIEKRYGILSVKSIFIHPGVFGWFTAFIALYSYAFYMIFNRTRYLWFGLLFSVGSFFSMRRRNLSGMAAALAMAIGLQPLAKKIRYGIIIGASAILFIILAWSKIEGLFLDLGTVYIAPDNPREEARNVLYMTSYTLLEEHFPWGAGLGRFGSFLSQIHYSPIYKKYGLSGTYGITRKNPKYITDTFWPAIIGETGFLGLVFYIWICWRIFRMLYRYVKRTSVLFDKAFFLGTFMVFVESIVESIAVATYTSPPTVYFIFGGLGLAFALDRDGIEE